MIGRWIELWFSCKAHDEFLRLGCVFDPVATAPGSVISVARFAGSRNKKQFPSPGYARFARSPGATFCRRLRRLVESFPSTQLELGPENKKPLHLNQEGWNGHAWLFLPSTVLTVSGSRGLPKNFELRNANFGF